MGAQGPKYREFGASLAEPLSPRNRVGHGLLSLSDVISSLLALQVSRSFLRRAGQDRPSAGSGEPRTPSSTLSGFFTTARSPPRVGA